MPSAAAAAADKTANADAGPSPPKKQDTGKGRGRALQLSVKTSVRRRGVARYDSTVALSGNARGAAKELKGLRRAAEIDLLFAFLLCRRW